MAGYFTNSHHVAGTAWSLINSKGWSSGLVILHEKDVLVCRT